MIISETYQTVRDKISAWKRYFKIYLNGGNEDIWSNHYSVSYVSDINTRRPIAGRMKRKLVAGQWVYRAMTEDEAIEAMQADAW